jgi:hypothetical protein
VIFSPSIFPLVMACCSSSVGPTLPVISRDAGEVAVAGALLNGAGPRGGPGGLGLSRPAPRRAGAVAQSRVQKGFATKRQPVLGGMRISGGCARATACSPVQVAGAKGALPSDESLADKRACRTAASRERPPRSICSYSSLAYSERCH